MEDQQDRNIARWISGEGKKAKPSVLLVEDEEMVAQLVTLMLTLEGFSVLHAESEPEALDLALGYRGAIDLLLADVRLKEGSGPGAARRLRLRFPEMKIAYMSGYPREELVSKGLIDEDAPFLPKPFDLAAFRSLIRMHFPVEAGWTPAH